MRSKEEIEERLKEVEELGKELSAAIDKSIDPMGDYVAIAALSEGIAEIRTLKWVLGRTGK